MARLTPDQDVGSSNLSALNVAAVLRAVRVWPTDANLLHYKCLSASVQYDGCLRSTTLLHIS